MREWKQQQMGQLLYGLLHNATSNHTLLGEHDDVLRDDAIVVPLVHVHGDHWSRLDEDVLHHVLPNNEIMYGCKSPNKGSGL